MNERSYALVHHTFGDPLEVLQLEETTEQMLKAPLGPTEVLVQILASPVHPATLYQIKGIYGIKPKLPAVPGLESCAEVVQTGAQVTSLQVGEKVS